MNVVSLRTIKLVLLLGLLCPLTLTQLTGLGLSSQAQPKEAKDCTACDREAQRNRPPSPCDPKLSAQETERIAQDKLQARWNLTPCAAEIRSRGCNDCHSGIEDMHNGSISLGCVDCHGGDATVRRSLDVAYKSAQYEELKKKAHVQPRFPEAWKTSGNPERPATLTLKEDPAFIRFVNPGDLRVSNLTCGTSECHSTDVHNVKRSMMTTGAMLWGAALYNNGGFPFKNARWGESYGPDGTQQRLQTNPQPDAAMTQSKGVLPYLDPLPRWEITQMGNILRTFERGGRKAAEIGNPLPEEAPGKPTQNLLSFRGLGTLLTTDPVYLGLQKTRLLDPMLSMMGTNDQPGDYRSSGCTACHVVYANDRDPQHSAQFAKFGHTGESFSGDAALCDAQNKGERGHPVRHQFTRAIPSSQCIVCHVHPGTNVLMTYYGSTWWDLETDAGDMYDPQKLSEEQKQQILLRNPEESSLRGKWRDVSFLDNLDKLNSSPHRKNTQFGDFAGHGWIFRDVFKRDRKGNLLDAQGEIIDQSKVTPELLQRATRETTDTPEARAGVPVHLKDIHLEKGMHCVDCHFKQDNHGNGKLYGEVRAAIEIDCVDCHGTVFERADPTSPKARTSAAAGGNRMLDYRMTPFNQDRFYKKNGQLYQRSAVESGKEWPVKQVRDTVDPASSHYNEKAALAKTIHKDGKTWGAPQVGDKLAHANQSMACFTCHLSWTPSCFGCHLKMTANQQKPMLHNEGEPESRNWTSYNFQTLRDDVFMLGKDGTVTGKRVAPVRSACAILVSSQNALREWIYSQQQTVSQEGYSGQAFSSHFPHTVRTKETKGCTDCHLSEKNDNNAWLAMATMQGTNFYNFIGRFLYVATGEHGYEAIVVTERDEPQAVIGSYLHKVAYPEEYKKHQEHHQELTELYEHPGNDIGRGLNPFKKAPDEVLSLQLRGEYLYAACGKGGFRIFDVANIDQKGFSERMTTAPFSPLGQKFYVKSKYATAIASPSTLAVDPTATVGAVLKVPTRRQYRPENEEGIYRDDKQAIHPVYAYLYGTDREEGLVVIGNPLDEKKHGPGVATLLDGDPNNNFIQRALAWNPNGLLKGANNITLAGVNAYITCDKGLVIVDLSDPLKPRLVKTIELHGARAVQIQFRYAFVCDAEGVKVLDVTNPAQARLVPGAAVKLGVAHNLYLVRTYAYVAAGKQGLVILDIENPEKPKLDQIFNAGGQINDAHDVKVGMTNVSLFAYVADGHNGLRVVQLTSPEETPGHYGFSPRPTPRLIASSHTLGPALAISEGIDRDRAIDENGNQLTVFGRRGARPFNYEEMMRLFAWQAGEQWQLFTVPEINDRNIETVNGVRQYRDIRNRYGKPRQANLTAQRTQEKH
jgi:hypothetical protein